MANVTKRVGKNGVVSYRVRVRLKGYPLQSASFPNRSLAKKWAQITEAAIREGRYFKNKDARKHTFEEFIDRYIRDVLPTKPKSASRQKSQLLWWKKKLGKYLLSDVGPSHIVECRDQLLQGSTKYDKLRSTSTVVRYLAALSHAYTIAIKEWGWIDESPTRRITKLKEPRGRIRFLDDQERKKLLQACKESKSPYLHVVVILALSTGMRQGEIMNLQWKNVDFQEKKIILHETKNGERRVVPLASYAFETFLEHVKNRKPETLLVFPGKDPNKPADLRHLWEKALEKAEIEDFRFHDLRHSAASYLAMGKATLAEIAEILGHKTLQMVKRYAHFSDSHTTGVVTKMNESIFAAEIEEISAQKN